MVEEQQILTSKKLQLGSAWHFCLKMITSTVNELSEKLLINFLPEMLPKETTDAFNQKVLHHKYNPL